MAFAALLGLFASMFVVSIEYKGAATVKLVLHLEGGGGDFLKLFPLCLLSVRSRSMTNCRSGCLSTRCLVPLLLWLSSLFGRSQTLTHAGFSSSLHDDYVSDLFCLKGSHVGPLRGMPCGGV